MKPTSGARLARLLERRGWTLLRVNGSHHIYAKAGEAARLSIPFPGNASLKLGLQRHLMKLGGLSAEDLE